MSPWKAGKDGTQKHHILPKHEQRQALGHVYDETTMNVTPEDHQKMHRDEREVGPYGSLVRQERRKLERSDDSK